ncbi:MAG: peptide deformylase [Candidatus Paceibacterota bacterium]|jgi:peptide deformylase
MVKIVQQKDPVLRKKARILTAKEISSDKIKKIIADMKEALGSCDDGIAIAAPQLGESIRLFVVSPKAFEIGRPKNAKTEKPEIHKEHLVCINPEIIKRSSKKIFFEEGCLSIRWLYGKIKRHSNVTLTALDENGNRFIRGAGGVLAEIFQHETDHLDGVLFTDTATDVISLPPEKQNKK